MRSFSPILLMVLIFAFNTMVNAQGLSESMPIPSDASVSLELDKKEYFIGENILLHYCVANTGKQPFKINMGGDYRGATRSLRFQVTATDEAGQQVTDPDTSGFCMGGISHSPEIKPGGRYYQSLPLTRYCRFEKPGIYTIRARHDLGWQETKQQRVPVAEIKIKILMPTAEQAGKIVAETYSLPQDQSVSAGQKKAAYADFSTLNYLVYLPFLIERAQQASEQALQAMATITSKEATLALIQLLDHKDTAFVLKVAQSLNLRLPDPEFTGEMGSRGPFRNQLDATRKALIRESWDSEFALTVRINARKLLASDERDRVICGAFMLQCVGEKDDLSAVVAAMDRAVIKTKDAPLEVGYPLPRGACQELLRAIKVFIKRGVEIPANPATAGEAALFVTALGTRADFRPKDWPLTCERLLQDEIPYLRELTLENLPATLPEPLLNLITARLKDRDINVKIAACQAASRTRLPIFLPLLLQIASATFGMEASGDLNFWLNNFASNAAVQLGGRFELLEIAVNHIDQPEMARQAFQSLVGVIKDDIASYGIQTEIDATKLPALKARWLAFLKEHKERLQAGNGFAIGDPALKPDLFPSGFQITRRNGSTWP